jgi:methylmalonyl-CoA mutase
LLNGLPNNNSVAIGTSSGPEVAKVLSKLGKSGCRVACDPIVEAATNGQPLVPGIADAVAQLRAGTGIVVQAGVFQEAGGSASQELAYGLSILVDVLDKATQAGLAIDEAVAGIELRFSVGTNYFVEIAKLRAARVLLAQVLKSFGAKSSPNVHAQTSRSAMTIYDPNVNMLRATSQAMSAAVAGVDSLCVIPYDTLVGIPDEFSQRIARNVQVILRDESYIGKVIDPLGGSYFVESLTKDIVESAWSLFQRLEKADGFAAAWEKGWPQSELADVRKAREKAAGTRRQPIVGTSNYPNLKETGPKVGDSAVDSPLALYRPSGQFESLRQRIDALVAKGGSRPVVALVLAGDAKMRKARATFVTGFFGSGGYAIEEVVGDDMASVAESIKDKAVVVLCSSDPEYDALTPALKQALKAAGYRGKLVIAGYPTDTIDALKAAGADEFVHIRLNVAETLSQFHQALGIPEVNR